MSTTFEFVFAIYLIVSIVKNISFHKRIKALENTKNKIDYDKYADDLADSVN